MASTTVGAKGKDTQPVRVHAEVPKGVETLIGRYSLMMPEERLIKIASFQPDPTDVFLSAGVKTGSTWLQHIMHELRSGGDMNFDDINAAVVLPDSLENVEEMSKPQIFKPRMFKSHLPYPFCPKGAAKYIVLVRSPKDVAVSTYWYFADWVFDKETLSINDYVDYFIASELPEEYSRFNSLPLMHQASWYPHRKDPNVLWLHYEDMKSDLRQCIKLISDFLNIGVGDQKLLDLVEEQSSFEFMKKHESKFDDRTFSQFLAKLIRESGQEVPERKHPKMRKGEVNGWTEGLSKEMAEAVDARWKSIFKPISGYDSYGEMRAGVNAELGRNFTVQYS